MKHAFLIIAHNNWNQLCRFIKAIDSEKCDFFVHVNSKINLQKETVDAVMLSAEKSKITFSKRIPITWGDFGICEASMVLLKTARNSGGYDYYHLLTGNDLLLKNIDEFDYFFERNLFSNISSHGKENHKTNYMRLEIANEKISERIKYYILIFLYKNKNYAVRKTATAINKIGKLFQNFFQIDRLKNLNEDLYYGSTWWSITDEFAEYFLQRRAWIINHFGKHTFAADEFVPQTIIMNSIFRDSVFDRKDFLDKSLRLIDWGDGDGYGSPHVWRFIDKEAIDGSNALIARKFDEQVDHEIVDYILNKLESVESEL